MPQNKKTFATPIFVLILVLIILAFALYSYIKENERLQSQMQLIQEASASKIQQLEKRINSHQPASYEFLPLAASVQYHGIPYDVYLINIQRTHLQLYLNDSFGAPYSSFEAIKNAHEDEYQRMVFAMNAGMYNIADRFGNACSAMQFDGNGYISVPSSASLRSPTTALTITGWFRLERNSKDDRTQLLWVTMVCKSNNSNESDNSPQYRLQLTEKTVSLNTDFTEEANQRWQLNKWYHAALVYSGSMVKAYLNGEQFFSYPYFGQLSSTNSDLEIGRDVPGNKELFVGQLDDIYIFNRALSKNEIMQIYKDQSNKNLTYDPCSGEPTLADSKPLPPTPPRSRNRTPDKGTEQPIPEKESEFSPYLGDDTPSSEKEITNFEVEGPYEGMTGQPMIWEGDTVYFQETVTVKNSNITIYPYDHQREDGDIISLNINGVWLLENYTIRNKGKDVKRASLSLLPEKENYLISKAWNLGKVPPNTLTLEIDDGSQAPKIVTINSEIGKSGAIKIIYKPEK